MITVRKLIKKNIRIMHHRIKIADKAYYRGKLNQEVYSDAIICFHRTIIGMHKQLETEYFF